MSGVICFVTRPEKLPISWLGWIWLTAWRTSTMQPPEGSFCGRLALAPQNVAAPGNVRVKPTPAGSERL